MIGQVCIKNIFIIYPLILKLILFILVSTASFGVSTIEYFPVDKNCLDLTLNFKYKEDLIVLCQ